MLVGVGVGVGVGLGCMRRLSLSLSYERTLAFVNLMWAVLDFGGFFEVKGWGGRSW